MNLNEANKTLKQFRTGAVIASIAILVSCISFVSQQDLNRIQPGMTKEQVSRAIGGKTPGDKGYQGGKEFWYFDIPVGYEQVQAKQVVFVNGQVVGIEDAPDRQKIIEKRLAEQRARKEAEAANTLFGQTCVRGDYSRQCPHRNQICVVERYGDSQGVCTIPCSGFSDCSAMTTNVGFLKCVDIRGGTRACWK